MIAFIVNLKAGGGRVGRIWSKVEAEISRRFGDLWCAAFTEGPMHAVELTRQQLRKGAEIIVSVGGDGTLNELLNGFFEGGKAIAPEAALSVLSFGTGADFIRTIGWPKDYLQALARLEKKNRRRIDIGRGEFYDIAGNKVFRYFINVAEFGMGGAVVAKVNNLSKRWGGRLSFMWGILTTTMRYQNQKVSFQCDDGEWRTEVLNNSVVANGRYFGSGIKPAPQAELDDGYLDVVTFGDVSVLEIVRALPRLKRGEHLSHPKVNAYRVKKIRAQSEESVLVDMDGEMVGRLPLEIEVIPEALYVCV